MISTGGNITDGHLNFHTSNRDYVAIPPTVEPFNETIIIANTQYLVKLALMEPVIFFVQRHQGDGTNARSKMLKGYLKLQVTKPIRISWIELSLTGIGKLNLHGRSETKEFRKHIWPIPVDKSSQKSSMARHGYSQHIFKRKMRSEELSEPGFGKAPSLFFKKGFCESPIRKVGKLLKYPLLCFSGGSLENGSMALHSELNRTEDKLQPGDYFFEFEELIDPWRPVTIHTRSCSVKWVLAACIGSPDLNYSTIRGDLEIPFVNIPSERLLSSCQPSFFRGELRNHYAYHISLAENTATPDSDVFIDLKFFPRTDLLFIFLESFLIEEVIKKVEGRYSIHVEPLRIIPIPGEHSYAMGNTLLNTEPSTTATLVQGNKSAVATNSQESDVMPCVYSPRKYAPMELKHRIHIPRNQQGRSYCRNRPTIHFDAIYEGIEITHKIRVSQMTFTKNPGYDMY